MILPKAKLLHQSEMFRIYLLHACRPNHPLVRVAEWNPWALFEDCFGKLFCPDNGPPGLPGRKSVRLLLLKHSHGVSVEEVIEWWLDSPYAAVAQCPIAGFHFRSEVQDKREAVLRWAQHVIHAEEDREILRRLLVAVYCLLQARKSNDTLRTPELPFIYLKIM